jgi:hypothetical protein
MNRKIARGLLTLFLILGVTWGCGGGGGFTPDPDITTDGDDDATSDVITDGEDDVPTDVPMDVPMDGVEDVPGDAPTDTPTDVEDDDGGGPGRTYIPFEAETSGGARISSTNYNLEVFIAPVRPVGNVSSTNYNLKLGPAGIRSN